MCLGRLGVFFLFGSFGLGQNKSLMVFGFSNDFCEQFLLFLIKENDL